MRHLHVLAAFSTITLGCTTLIGLAPAAFATTAETGDAGDALATAQLVTGTETSISGALTSGSDRVDMFQISINDPSAFSASTVSGTTFDTNLALFDETGHLVEFNDDASEGWASYLPPGSGGNTYAPATAGTYYLAVGAYPLRPYTDTNAPMCAVCTGTTVSGPADAAYQLHHWGDPLGTLGPTGSYTVTLTGVGPQAAYTEIGDAPALPPGQDTVGVAAAIEGTLGVAGDIDMFGFCAAGSFSAEVTEFPGTDSELVLFYDNGGYITYNDDIDYWGGNRLSRLVHTMPDAPDHYLLAVGAFGITPNGNPLSSWDSSGSVTGDYTIELIGVVPCTGNESPVAVDDSYPTTQGATLNIAAPGVLGNDSDPDGDPLVVSHINPTGSRLTMNADGSFTYAPGATFTGDDVYAYGISDGELSGSGTITITVTPWTLDSDVETGSIEDLVAETWFDFDEVATPDTGAEFYWSWTGNDDDIYLYGSDHWSAPAVDVAFVNDTDLCSIEATTLTYSLEDREALGVTDGFVVLRTTSGPYYIAFHVNEVLPPYPGTLDATWYVQTDGSGSFCATDNTAPVAVDDTYSVDEDTTLTVPEATGVLFNDTDVDDDSLTAAVVTSAANGTLLSSPDGSFTYAPNPNFNGSDSFTYTANDGTDDSDVATVSITVNAVNDAPTEPASLGQFLPDDTVLAVGASTTQTSVRFAGTLTDPVEGDQVKLEVEIDPVGTAFAGDGLHTGSLVASGSAASVTINALTPGPYHWRARTVDDEGATSAWVAFGDNAETAADCEIHAIASLLYTGDQLVRHGEDVTVKAVLSSDWGGCVAGQPVEFSLPDDNPLTETIDDGPYELDSDVTNSSGLAELAAIHTSNWQPGVYTVRARFAETSACEPSFDEATLTVAPTGDSASGGGFYTLPGNGRVNFGFTVSMVPGTEADPQYKGQLLLINNGKWRLKGVLDDYVALDTSGAASGTGNLYWWDATLDEGLGDWVLSDTDVPFTISFDDIGKGKNSQDAFGIHIDYVVDGEPNPLPNSEPQPLKGGNVTIHEDSSEPTLPPEEGESGNNGKKPPKDK